jgi:Ran GTPase-activating protein (RanGAP) involved in mRNA processing and transport
MDEVSDAVATWIDSIDTDAVTALDVTEDVLDAAATRADGHAVGDLLRQCVALTHLNISFPQTSSACLEGLMASLPTCGGLESLRLQQIEMTTDDLMICGQCIAACPRLTEVTIGYIPFNNGGGAVLRHILHARQETLQTLILEECLLDGTVLVAVKESLKRCTQLQYLDLGINPLGTAGIRVVAEVIKCLPGLSTLMLDDTLISEENAFFLLDALPSCPSLRWLTVGSNDLGDEGGKLVAAVLPHLHLRTLDLHNCRLRLAGITALARQFHLCPTLQAVNVNDNQLFPAAVLELARGMRHCPLMVQFDFGLHAPTDEMLQSILAELVHCAGLENIRWRHHPIEAGQFRAITQILPVFPNLRYLELAWAAITAEMLPDLSAVLPQCRELLYIGLEHNTLIGPAVANLMDAVAQLPRLRKLNLRQTGLTDLHLQGLAQRLPQCAELEMLTLSDNHLTDAGIQILAARIPWCRALTQVSIHPNAGVTIVGLTALSTALRGAANHRRFRQNLFVLAAATRGQHPPHPRLSTGLMRYIYSTFLAPDRPS